MEKKQPDRRPTMGGPATYRIRVRGYLDAHWSDRIGEMKITESRGPDGEAESVLVGRLADQAALSGVLNTLYDLHLPLVSVEFVDRGKQ
jgi:hypothetical protein